MKIVLALTLALVALVPTARADDEKPYKVENGKVDQATFNGYRRYGNSCLPMPWARRLRQQLCAEPDGVAQTPDA